MTTLAGVPGLLLYTGGRWRIHASTVALLAALWALIAVAAIATGLLNPGFAALCATAGLVCASAVAAALQERLGSTRLRMALSAAFSVLIFFPLVLVVFGGSGTWLYDEAGALDFGGALPITIGTGTFAVILAILSGTRSVASRPLALRGAMLLAVAALASVVGMELRLDELTPAIALHALMTPAVALLAAAGIERVMRGMNTREGMAAGALAGTAAAIASCAYLETVSALLLGLLVGAVAEVAYRGASAGWRLGTPLLIGGVTGMLFLGIFAIGPGFVYSGQSVLFLHQAVVAAISLGYAAVISAALLIPLRRKLDGGRYRT